MRGGGRVRVRVRARVRVRVVVPGLRQQQQPLSVRFLQRGGGGG